MAAEEPQAVPTAAAAIVGAVEMLAQHPLVGQLRAARSREGGYLARVPCVSSTHTREPGMPGESARQDSHALTAKSDAVTIHTIPKSVCMIVSWSRMP